MNVAAQTKSNNNFIDENHENLLATMDVLEKSLHLDWRLKAFLASTNLFITSLENHFLHEETLLRGAGFSGLDKHTVKHREIALNLRKSALAISSHELATDFISKVRSQILNHELISDQEYWPVLEPIPKHEHVLISWSKELETGNADVDKQHKALAAYINRFHSIYFNNASRRYACSELRSLYAYSKLHFSEEESLLGDAMGPVHAAQHEQLLNDLSLLISEVDAGEYELGNISSHLKYWFLNHLKSTDIPAFKNFRSGPTAPTGV